MMKILTRLLGAIAALILLLAVIGLFLPTSVTVKRSITIDAPPATVFTLVNGFSHFNRFSPWVDMDPKATYEFSGPRFGEGAAMSWFSEEPQVGNGRQEIIESVPYETVTGIIEFDEEGTATVSFDLEEVESATQVTWSFRMDFGYDIVSRYFGLMMNELVGKDYEQGLKRLKRIAEEYPKLDIAGFEPREIEVEETQVVKIGKRTTMDPTEMVASIAAAFSALDTFLQINELEPVGMPRIITQEWNEAEQTWIFEAAYPIPRDSFVERGAPGVERGVSYSGPALEVVLEGADWETSTATYEKMDLYMRLHGLDAAADSWEAYESDPVTTPPAELVTHIVFPVTRLALQQDEPAQNK